MPYNLIDIEKLFVEFPVSILASINTFRNTIAVKYFDSTAGIAFTDTFGRSKTDQKLGGNVVCCRLARSARTAAAHTAVKNCRCFESARHA